jgi:protein-arginine kinase activator protein McsA
MELNEKIIELKLKEKELQEELAEWEGRTPVNNMGKWARQTKIDRISEKLKKVQEKIHFHDSIYLSNEIYKQWKKDVK